MGPNFRTKREQILTKMKYCSQYMMLIAVMSIVLGVIDIETQYKNAIEHSVEESMCSIRTQKDAHTVSSLSQTSFVSLQVVRVLISLTSIINVALIVVYHKLGMNLINLKQNIDSISWKRYLMLLTVEWPNNWTRLGCPNLESL